MVQAAEQITTANSADRPPYGFTADVDTYAQAEGLRMLGNVGLYPNCLPPRPNYARVGHAAVAQAEVAEATVSATPTKQELDALVDGLAVRTLPDLDHTKSQDDDLDAKWADYEKWKASQNKATLTAPNPSYPIERERADMRRELRELGDELIHPESHGDRRRHARRETAVEMAHTGIALLDTYTGGRAGNLIYGAIDNVIEPAWQYVRHPRESLQAAGEWLSLRPTEAVREPVAAAPLAADAIITPGPAVHNTQYAIFAAEPAKDIPGNTTYANLSREARRIGGELAAAAGRAGTVLRGLFGQELITSGADLDDGSIRPSASRTAGTQAASIADGPEEQPHHSNLGQPQGFIDRCRNVLVVGEVAARYTGGWIVAAPIAAGRTLYQAGLAALKRDEHSQRMAEIEQWWHRNPEREAQMEHMAYLRSPYRTRELPALEPDTAGDRSDSAAVSLITEPATAHGTETSEGLPVLAVNDSTKTAAAEPESTENVEPPALRAAPITIKLAALPEEAPQPEAAATAGIPHWEPEPGWLDSYLGWEQIGAIAAQAGQYIDKVDAEQAERRRREQPAHPVIAANITPPRITQVLPVARETAEAPERVGATSAATTFEPKSQLLGARHDARGGAITLYDARVGAITRYVAIDMDETRRRGRHPVRDRQDMADPNLTMTRETASQLAGLIIANLRTEQPELVRRAEAILADRAAAHAARAAEPKPSGNDWIYADLVPATESWRQAAIEAQRRINLDTVATEALLSVHLHPKEERAQAEHALTAGIYGLVRNDLAERTTSNLIAQLQPAQRAYLGRLHAEIGRYVRDTLADINPVLNTDEEVDLMTGLAAKVKAETDQLIALAGQDIAETYDQLSALSLIHYCLIPGYVAQERKIREEAKAVTAAAIAAPASAVAHASS